MNINTLFKLVGQGEGACLDFKRDLSDKDACRSLTKLMAAFANTEGGVILFGVEDNGDVIGVSDPDKIVVSLADYARNNCQPALYPQFETLPLGDGKSVVCVSIARQQDQLCLVRGKCHIRIGSQSQTVEDLNEISRIYARLRGKRAEEGWEAGGGPAVLFTPVAPPSGKGFKGREEQLKFLSDCLDSKEISIVVIEGISGIGKSALAGQFALHVSKKDYSPCWITCHPETTFDALSFELSGFARAQGFDEAADLLEESRGRFEDRIIRIASALARCRCALFLDDFHLVADPKVDGLLRGIEERSGLTKVFLTARRRPSLASQVRPIGLAQMRLQEGLDPDSCEQLLRECGPDSLDRATAHRIWELSGKGHPKALQIFAGRARSVPIEELLSTLPVFRDDLKEVWLKPLLEELPEQQRAVVVDLSVFDRPLPLSSLPLLYPDRAPGDLEEIRRGLIERFILDFVTGGLMQMHPLIRDYCYDSLLSNRQELHEWAGFFYQQLAFNSDDVEEYGSEAVTDKQVENGIAAWSHFVRAGEHERATKIVGQIREPLLTSVLTA